MPLQIHPLTSTAVCANRRWSQASLGDYTSEKSMMKIHIIFPIKLYLYNGPWERCNNQREGIKCIGQSSRIMPYCLHLTKDVYL